MRSGGQKKDVGGNLEVVSKEKFQQQKQGMSSCIDCLKERISGDFFENRQHRGGRKHGRKSASTHRVNSPIVVSLQDTIKVSVKRKSISTESEDSQGSSSEDSSQNSSKGKKEIVSLNNLYHRKSTQDSEFKGQRHLKKNYSHSKYNRKNFNAFLSAIERVHQKKQPIRPTNLEAHVISRKEKQIGGNLNNVLLLESDPVKRRNLKLQNKQNIEVICNDLSGLGSLTIDSEDSASLGESSDTSSSIELSSDSTPSLSETDSSSGEELGEEELERLTKYTTGFPLTRYECPAEQCPECLASYYAYWNHWYGTGFGRMQDYTIESMDTENSDSDDDEDDEEDDDHLGVFDVRVTGTKKAEVCIGALRQNKHQRHKRLERRMHDIRNSVYVELLDSSTSISVEYKSTQEDTYSSHSSHSPWSDSQPNWGACYPDNAYGQHFAYPANYYSPCYNDCYQHHISDNSHYPSPHKCQFYDNCQHFKFASSQYGYPSSAQHYHHHPQGNVLLPVTLPFYLLPIHFTGMAPIPAMPKPLCIPRDLQCLKSQRLCMVPATEIKKFSATQPPQRPWITLANLERDRPVAIYTVMCYNVLCDKYATRSLYGYCPSWALNWDYRKKGIIDEIRHYSADIIALQEVETEQYHTFFLPELKKDGYNGIFSPKSRARTMLEADRKHVDGCAIFYRTEKFSLIKETLIEFNQLAMSIHDGSHDMLNRVMTKDNIGLTCLLETKESTWHHGSPPEGQVRQPILVATCHVHWDPEYSDVKLIQTMMLMNELQNIIKDNQTSLRPGATKPDCNNIPLLLCGDLNSLPESGVVEFLNKGRIPSNHVDFKEMAYDECLQKLSLTDNKDVFSHGFKLAQAYTDKDYMPYTNYTFDFKGVIDYIFFSREWMRPLGILGPMEQEWFDHNRILGCPHPHIPSDHLPLLVELELSPSMTPGVPAFSAPGGGRSSNISSSTIGGSSQGVNMMVRR